MARRTTCPDCGADWRRATARFCGRCGAGLATTGESDRGQRRAAAPAHRSVRLLATGLAILAMLAVAVAVEAVRGAAPEVDGPPAAGATEVRLPPPASLGTAREPDASGGHLTCEPRGCEQWRLRLAGPLEGVAVTGRWIAVVDGTRLRVRGATRSDPFGGGWAVDLREVTTAEGRPVAAVTDDGRVRLRDLVVTADGTVVLAQPDGLFAVGRDGTVRWHRVVERLRSIHLRDDHLVVFAAPASAGGRSSDDALAVSVADGSLVWRQAAGRPLPGAPDGILTLHPDGTMALLDPAAGTARWERNLDGARWARVEGPWVVVGRRERGSLLLDGATGEILERHPDRIPLGRMQHGAGIAVGAWLHLAVDGQPTDEVSVTAWDADGERLWDRSLPDRIDDPCCVVALPWTDGTVAIGRPVPSGAAWTILDAATGTLRAPPAPRPPNLPDGTRAAPLRPPSAVGRVYVDQDADTLWLASGAGQVTVRAAADVTVVSVDPVILARRGELVGLRLIGAG